MHVKKTAYQGELGGGFEAELKDFMYDLRRHFTVEVKLAGILASK
jgi:hypothetical protein